MLHRAFSDGLEAIIAIAGATTPGDFRNTLHLASRYDRVFAAAGIHPHGASEATHDNLEKLTAALDHPQVPL